MKRSAVLHAVHGVSLVRRAPVRLQGRALHVLVAALAGPALAPAVQQRQQLLGLVQRAVRLALGLLPHGVARPADAQVRLQHLRTMQARASPPRVPPG